MKLQQSPGSTSRKFCLYVLLPFSPPFLLMWNSIQFIFQSFWNLSQLSHFVVHQSVCSGGIRKLQVLPITFFFSGLLRNYFVSSFLGLPQDYWCCFYMITNVEEVLHFSPMKWLSSAFKDAEKLLSLFHVSFRGCLRMG